MEPYWLATQRALQHGCDAMVKRPKLTEALLKRPPFRFIHDIVSEVTRRTGFGEGLFTGDELIPSELKDKDSKLRYLTKIINCVGLTLNANVPVRPAKILAGLEPEQTNVFLQMLAQAATSDSQKATKAVYRCLAGDFMPSSDHSGLISRESASSNQSVSSEKLRRSIYSPTPDTKAQEITIPSSQPDSTKVPVLYGSGEANEQDDEAMIESMASKDDDQALMQSEHQEGFGRFPDEELSEAFTEATGTKVETDGKKNELQRLRESIQALCQAISPLGKFIDYLQEDTEAMSKEYQFWINLQQKHGGDLQKERLRTEEVIQAESRKILDLDEQIKCQEQLNNIAKAEIFKNDETAMALLQAASTARRLTRDT